MAPKIVLISGTDRPGSNTLKISKQVEAMMKAKGHDVTLLDAGDLKNHKLEGDYFNPPASFVEAFSSKMSEADGFILLFPEYNGSFPAPIKTIIDYAQPGNMFASKPVSMISDSAGDLGGLVGASSLAMIMNHKKADVIGQAYVMIKDIDNKMQDGRIVDPEILARIENSIQVMVKKSSTKYQMQMQMNEFIDLAIETKRAVNVELSSQVQVAGHLTEVQKDSRGFPISLTLKGLTEITNSGVPISYQLLARQNGNMFVPIGLIKTVKGAVALSEFNTSEKLATIGLKIRQKVSITYTSGITVNGVLSNTFFSNAGKLQVLTLNDATVSKDGIILKEYSTDLMDLLVGENISSVSQFRIRQ